MSNNTSILWPSKSCRSSKLTSAVRKRRPKVCFRSCTLTCAKPARTRAFFQAEFNVRVMEVYLEGMRIPCLFTLSFLHYPLEEMVINLAFFY